MPDDHDHDSDHDCPVCNASDHEEAMEDFIKQLDELATKHGHTTLFIGGDGPETSYTYTIGLAERGWPELVIYSINPETARMMFNLVVNRLKDIDAIPEAGMTIEKALNVPVHLGLISEDRLSKHFVLATRRAEDKGYGEILRTKQGPSVRGLQLVWPDTAGRFPSDPDYDHKNFPQPLLSDKAKLH